jgi:hypothetical protein
MFLFFSNKILDVSSISFELIFSLKILWKMIHFHKFSIIIFYFNKNFFTIPIYSLHVLLIIHFIYKLIINKTNCVSCVRFIK